MSSEINITKTRKDKSFADYFRQVSHGGPDNGIQGALSGASQWLDLLFTMLFDPESYELKKAVYGVEGFEGFGLGSEEAKRRPTEAARANEILKGRPPCAATDRLRIELVNHFTDGTPLNAQTLLHPEMLQACSADPAQQKTLDSIIAECDSYNKYALQKGVPELDPYTVANWLWSKNEFNCDEARNIAATVTDLARINSHVGNEYLALMIYENGGVDIDRDGNLTAVNAATYDEIMDEIREKIAKDMGVPVDQIDLSEHMPDQIRHYTEILNLKNSAFAKTLQATNSVYWDEAQRIAAKAGMEKLGLTTTRNDDPEADREVEFSPNGLEAPSTVTP